MVIAPLRLMRAEVTLFSHCAGMPPCRARGSAAFAAAIAGTSLTTWTGGSLWPLQRDVARALRERRASYSGP
jgi:hypothetical protein